MMGKATDDFVGAVLTYLPMSAASGIFLRAFNLTIFVE